MAQERFAPVPHEATTYVIGFQTTQDMLPALRQDISSRATREHEWARSPETQAIIRQDQQYIASAPESVHVRFLLGPSVLAKTTIADHMAGVNRLDGRFRRALNKGRKPGEPQRQFMGLHISLSEALRQAAREQGIRKKDITETERHIASQRIVDAIDVLRNVFTHDPEYTVAVYVDTVGITESDLGTEAVRHFVNDPFTRFFFPEPNQQVEESGLAIRREMAQIAQERRNPTGTTPNASRYLRKMKKIPGIDMRGREERFVESCGMEDAWRRHWADVLTQMKKVPGTLEMTNDQITLDSFLKDFDLRAKYYLKWLPVRMEELGIDYRSDQAQTLPNLFADEIHTHFDRMYLDPAEAKHEVYHFPMQLLGPDVDLHSLTKEQILQAMGFSQTSTSTSVEADTEPQHVHGERVSLYADSSGEQ